MVYETVGQWNLAKENYELAIKKISQFYPETRKLRALKLIKSRLNNLLEKQKKDL